MRLRFATLGLPASLFVTALAAQAPLAPTTPADTAARPIRLAEAIQLAQKNAPAAVQAAGAVRTSQAALRAAYGAFIPSLNLTASSALQIPSGVAITANNQVFNGRSVTTEGFNASLDLFDGLRRIYDVRASRADIGAAQATVVAQQYSVALQVQQQFYAVLAARESESAAQAQLDQAVQQLQVSRAMVQAQTATKSDSLRAIIQVGNAQLALLTARNDLQTANATLTRLIAAPFTVTASPADTVGETRIAVDSVTLERLATQGPAVQAALAGQTSAHAAARAARAPYFPTLSVSYSGNNSATDTALTLFAGLNPRFSGSLRFTLSYPIFNQFTREQNIELAQVAEDNATAAARDAALLARQNLVTYLGALRTAEQQIGIQQVSVAAAEEDLRVQQQRYQLHASTLLDVLTSQTALNQARAALIQARYNYRVAKAQLESLVGRTL